MAVAIKPFAISMKKNFLLLFFLLLFGNVQAQNIGGIGAQLIVDSTDGYTMPRIYSLIQRSPAWDSLRATDYIIKVNDVSCKNKPLEDIVAMIRGVAGTSVKITTADTKEGKSPRDHTLVRVSMQVAGVDPTATFYDACDKETEALRKSGSEVLKTFNSDCGNYFFNLNADAGTYHVRAFFMADKSNTSAPAKTKVFDNDNEKEAVTLAVTSSSNKGDYTVVQQDGTITFRRDAVCTISVTFPDGGKRCAAMYIVVYK